MRQLVRHALRRGEIRAARCAAIGRTAVRLTALLSGIFVVCALLVPARISCRLGPSRVDTTRLRLRQYAFEAYPSWSLAHPDLACPRSLHELTAYMAEGDRRDAWGHPFEFRCGPDLPAGAKGIWVRSAGMDGQFNTPDDIDSSW